MIPVMTRWAVYADNAIGGYRLLKRKIAVLEFKNCAVELPCDIVCLLPGMLWGDYGCSCDLTFNDFRTGISSGMIVSPVDGFTVIDTGSGGSLRGWLGSYTIQDNKLVFKQNFNGQKVTIQYLGMQVDGMGLPMILENHVEAVSQYIQYKLAKQTRFKTKEYRVSDTGIMDERREWNRLCRHARAEDAQPTEEEMANAIAIINNPYSGIRNACWVYGEPGCYGLLPFAT